MTERAVEERKEVCVGKNGHLRTCAAAASQPSLSLSIEGGRPLRGEVEVDGAKNAALPALAAALLTDDPVVLHRVPALRDVATMVSTIASLGKRVEDGGPTVHLEGSPARGEPDGRLVEQMRASILVLGPLVARLGEAVVPLPGGCTIGRRPIDYHLDGLRALGAAVEERPDAVAVRATRLRGARIRLPFPSVGATEQLVMAATLADGETTIENPAHEPEVLDLIALLQAMGARIEVPNGAIRVRGVPRLHGAEHTVISDRLEAGTYLLAGAITGGEVIVRRAVPAHLAPFLAFLRQAGLSVQEGTREIAITGRRARPVDVTTAPHPGFPTDLQPPLVAWLALGEGRSTVRERVFEKRFEYVPSLEQMGARILVEEDHLAIDGVPSFRGADVEAPDIRAGAALVLAGLAAPGRTTVSRVERIERGYARMDEKLRRLGGAVERRAG
jgi:UDP-N-acetylglucosamine 1-carboxyvinyltransferase